MAPPLTQPDLVLVGSYDYRAVALSVVIAVVGSFVALDLAGRVTAAGDRAWGWWLAGGATAMGIGIWSMHFTGMLAFHLPVPIRYHWPTAALSFLPSFLTSVFGLFVASRPRLGSLKAWISGSLMGGGIVGMHYLAMESMRFGGMCHYSPALVALSIVFAIALSLLSVLFMFRLRRDLIGETTRKLGSALLMAAAICIMHYTGMASASYTRSNMAPDFSHSVSISFLGIVAISQVTLMVLALTLVTSLADRFYHSKEQFRALAGRLESLREDERVHISREIHDELGQKLTGLKMDLQWVERKLDELAGSPAVNAVLDRVVGATELVDETIRAVQGIAAELRPGVLDKLGLGTALEYEARRFQERTGTACRVELPKVLPNFSVEVATALFRIFQECLTNVARHAQATRIDTELTLDDGSVTLTVRDNGRGLTEEEVANRSSLGLLGMKERAWFLGGEVLFKRGADVGTTVTARVPTGRQSQARSEQIA